MHVEGVSPWVAASVGAAAGGALAGGLLAILTVLGLANADGNEPVFAVFATAIAAGGAASLTLKNLNLKRAESRRALRTLHDEHFRHGAETIGGRSELQVIAGALLLGKLLRESPHHAQACADLLCAALRREEADGEGSAERAAVGRIRNAISRALADSIAGHDAPPHIELISWRFADIPFGAEVNFDGCVFGPGTVFERSTFVGEARFAGARFAGDVEFRNVQVSRGLLLSGARVGGWIQIRDCGLVGAPVGSPYGISLARSEAAGVVVDNVVSDGPVQMDDARIDGDVRVSHATVQCFSFIDGWCNRSLELHAVQARDYIRVRNTPVRKGVLVDECTAGQDIEVTSARNLGTVSIQESSAAGFVNDSQ